MPKNRKRHYPAVDSSVIVQPATPVILPPWRQQTVITATPAPIRDPGHNRSNFAEFRAERRSLEHRERKIARQSCTTLDTELRRVLCLPVDPNLGRPTPVTLETAILFTELCITTAYDEESVDSLVSLPASSDESDELPHTPILIDGYASDEQFSDVSCWSV
jgi:hypothetical protein